MKLKTVILAAGKGTRMKSTLPKVLHKVNGIPMVSKIIKTLSALKPEENILILGYKKEVVLETIGDVKYALQEEQLGTGHAVLMAKEELENYDGDVLVVCGDTPLLKEETLKKLHSHHIEKKSVATVLTAIYENPFGYGRIIKNETENVMKIVEEKDATPEQKNIREVNSGVYCFNSKKLFEALQKINNSNNNNEYYLTDIIEILNNENEITASYLLEDNMEILGVNSKVELAQAEKILRDRKNKELLENGVTLIDPNSTYIEEEVMIAEDTVIYPNVHIQGKTKIGKNCEILGDTRIIDSEIMNNIKIERSVIENSYLEDGVTIGPFAHLRPLAHLKKNVHVGNFVEIKKSTLEDGVKVGHLTYLGDAKIGEATNVGAGTITCNYDGIKKSETNIGKSAFIGSGTMLVAPIEVGNNAVTGAGSVITKDIPSDALAVERSKQLIIKEWNKKND